VAAPHAAQANETTFRPKLFHTPIDEIDYRLLNPRHEELIIQPELVVETEVETTAEVYQEQEQEYTTKFKLNSVGMIAVVSFIAVTVMVVAFIIANSIAISGSATRIANLRASNATNTARVQALQNQNQAAQIDQQYYADQRFENRVINTDGTITVQNSDGTYTILHPAEVITIPPNQPTWTAPADTTPRTSFFDRLSRFFSRLFTGG
jgi:hypothetical protein